MYEFTEEDLKYNKRGQLSPSQQEWLKMIARGSRKSSWTGAFITIGFAFLGMCIMAALFLQNERSRAALFSDPMNLVILAAVIPLILGILALAIFFNYRNANKLENAVISSASGAVRHDYDSSGESGITTYFVIVGKKKFKFGDDMSSTFKEGEKYKFYYCKAGVYEFVMSYEKII
jgi:hypothetical protein